MSSDPYAPPPDESLEPAGDYAELYVVSVSKFVVLSLLTNGLYNLYWHYRQWRAWRKITGTPVIAWLRAVFAIFFVWSLFTKIDVHLRATKWGLRWYPRWRVIVLIVLSILSSATIYLEGFPVLSIASSSVILVLMTLLMTRAQMVINHLAGDPRGVSNSRYGWANALWMVVGGLLWMLAIDLALSTPDRISAF